MAAVLSTLSYAATDRIAGPVNSNQTVALAKSLHPKARQEFDRGAVDPSFKLSYMTLVTTPSATQQKALSRLLAQQQDPTSANYRKWLTPAEYADQFGLSQRDIDRVTTWLKSQGFAIVSVSGGRNSVTFRGTAAQVQRAFKTEIHRYDVDGEPHVANSTPLMIPAALDGIVGVIRGIHDFRMHPALRSRGMQSMRNARPEYFDGSYIFPNFLAPADVATIYQINPLYTAATPINGTGQKIAVVGQTDIFLADLNDFRTGFGLSQITGCTTTTTGVPGLITACNTSNFKYVLIGTDPGTPSANDIGEADLDVEWSGAIAPNAQVVFVNAPQTSAGVNDALAAAINPPSGPPLANVITMSYGICEAFAADLETELQQGNAEGVTIMNSSGDQGAAGCDNGPPNATPPYSAAVGGLAVNYPASSQYVTGVGGTAISLANDSYPTPSSYWSTTNGANGGTAQSYIPETPWNDDEELASFCVAAPTISFCKPSPGVVITNAQTFQEDYWVSEGGGGASNCFGETSGGVCTSGFPQPTWQQGLTVAGAPAGVRWVPDVSMLASPNFPGYIFCTPQNPPTVYTSTCAGGIFAAVDTNQSIVGGTSVSSPVFAGIVALLNQVVNGTSPSGLGNINSTLYTLAKTPSNLAFNKVTTGDNKVYCQPGKPTIQPTALQCPSTGILGYSASNADATTGYNLVTGLGSVNAFALAQAWPNAKTSSTTALVAAPTSVNQGASVTLTATVTPAAATGTVTFYVGGTTSLGTGTLNASGVATLMTTALPVGTDNVTATYGGDTTYASSTSSGQTVTVAAVDFTIATNPTSATVAAGNTTGAITVTLAAVNGFSGQVTMGCGNSLPAGTVCNFSPSTTVTAPGSVTLTISTPANGPSSITVPVTGTSGNLSHSANFALTLTPTTQSFTLAPNAASYPVAAGGSVTATLTVTPTNGFSLTSTPVTYTCTDPASESQCSGPSGPTVSTSPSFLITTTAPTGKLQSPFGRSAQIFYAVLFPGLLGIMFLSGSRKRSLRGMRLLGLIVVLGFSTVWMGSCGGSTSPSNRNPGTPPGNYSVVVNATTGGANPVTATTTINLVVSQ